MNILTDLLLFMIIFPPFGFFVVFVIVVAIGELIGKLTPSDDHTYSSDYSSNPPSAEDISGMYDDDVRQWGIGQFLKDKNPKAYDKWIEKHPEDKVRYGYSDEDE